jgi:pilus assembly protein FimV
LKGIEQARSRERAANQRTRSIMKPFKKTISIGLLVLIWCAAMPFAARAAGLAGINVNSALGQPFSAEIEITGLPQEDFEFELAKGSLASAEAYQDAKLAFPPLLRQMRITTEKRADGKPILRIVSNAPINEPALNLLIEFNWRGGRLLQKFSILLDPPK